MAALDAREDDVDHERLPAMVSRPRAPQGSVYSGRELPKEALQMAVGEQPFAHGALLPILAKLGSQDRFPIIGACAVAMPFQESPAQAGVLTDFAESHMPIGPDVDHISVGRGVVLLPNPAVHDSYDVEDEEGMHAIRFGRAWGNCAPILQGQGLV